MSASPIERVNPEQQLARRRKYLNYLNGVCSDFNSSRIKTPGSSRFNRNYRGDRAYPYPPVRVSHDLDNSAIDTLIRYDEDIAAYCEGNDGEGDSGLIRTNQMQTLMAIIHELATNDRVIGETVAPMNAGKTGVQNAMPMAALTHRVVTGQDCVIAQLFPNSNRLQKQTNNARGQHLGLHAPLEIKGAHGTVAYRDYLRMENQFETRLQQFTKTVGPGRPGLRIKANSSSKKKFEAILACARQHNTALLVVYDESHALDTRDGFQNWMWDRLEQAWQNGLNCKYIGFSATPFTKIKRDPKRVWYVGMRLTPEYRGFNWFGENKIDPHTDILPPDMESFEQAETRLDVKNFSLIRRGLYEKFSIKKARRLGLAEKYLDQHSYRRLCVTALVEAIRKSLITNNVRGSNGLILRWTNNNSDARALAERLSRLLPEVDFDAYVGQSNQTSMREVIEPKVKTGRPFVLIVTGAGRMGDDVPRSVAYFWDFTDRTVTMAALLQGLLGRACGWKKNSLVTMSEANLFVAREYARTGQFQTRPAHNMYVTGQTGPGRRRSTVMSKLQITDTDKEPEAKRVLAEVTRMVKDIPFVMRESRNGGESVTYGSHRNRYLPFTPKVLALMQKVLQKRGIPGQILVPGMLGTYKGEDGYRLHKKHGGYAVGFRGSEYAHGDTQTQSRGDRLKNERLMADREGKYQEAQAHVNVRGLGSEIVSLSWPLKDPVETTRVGADPSSIQIVEGRSSHGREIILGKRGVQNMRRDNQRDGV